MDTDRTQASDEIRFSELVAILWDSKLLIAAVTAVCFLAGIGAYSLSSPSYASRATALPLRQTQFSGYLGLAQEDEVSGYIDPENPISRPAARPALKPGEEDGGAFPYTPATLFTEFVAYVTDPDRLADVAVKTGVVVHQNAGSFASGIKFTTPKPQEIQAGLQFLTIEAKAGDGQKLTAFMQQLLLTANKDMAVDLAADVRMRADEIKEKLASQAAKLQVDIDARRHTQESVRTDNIVRLAEQSAIARSVGIQKPINLQAVEATEQGKATAAQINTFGQQQLDYQQGYTALDESIAKLRDRKDGDPFIEDLRTVEQQLYAVKNDPRPARIQALLERSPLRDPATAVMARFSTETIGSSKTFPKLSIFGVSGLLLGLVLGSIFAFLRNSWIRSVRS